MKLPSGLYEYASSNFYGELNPIYSGNIDELEIALRPVNQKKTDEAENRTSEEDKDEAMEDLEFQFNQFFLDRSSVVVDNTSTVLGSWKMGNIEKK